LDGRTSITAPGIGTESSRCWRRDTTMNKGGDVTELMREQNLRKMQKITRDENLRQGILVGYKTSETKCTHTKPNVEFDF
jgi:hypothetical protein